MIEKDKNPLTYAFVDFLKSGAEDHRSMRVLVDLFSERGLWLESQALKGFWDRRERTETIMNGPWSGKTVSLSHTPPLDEPAGSLWFDLTDLTPMVCIHLPKVRPWQTVNWVATRPVHLWQYLAFLSLVKLGPRQTPFPAAVDAYKNRFIGKPEVSYACNVYHDEALAYVHWFGKHLGGVFEWDAARTNLTSAQYDCILPPGFVAWQEAEYPCSEFVRCAAGQKSLLKSAEEEHNEEQQRRDGVPLAKIGLPNRTMFEEWERQPEVGFSSSLVASKGRTATKTSKTLFFELMNPFRLQTGSATTRTT